MSEITPITKKNPVKAIKANMNPTKLKITNNPEIPTITKVTIIIIFYLSPLFHYFKLYYKDNNLLHKNKFNFNYIHNNNI